MSADTHAALVALARRWVETGWSADAGGDSGRIVDELHAPRFIDHDSGGRAPDNEGFRAGIVRLLAGTTLPDPARARGVPRCELYLVTPAPAAAHARAIAAGASELSPLQPRDWGHDAAYSLDPDGHVLAFAMPSRTGR